MANRFAVASGSFSFTTTWSTTAGGASGASVPVAGDVAIANGRTVTIAANATCDEVRNDTTGGATGGGSFTLNNGVTLTANVFTGSANCVNYAGLVGNSAAIVGNVTGGSSNNGRAVTNASTGTLNITGNIIGGVGSGAEGADNGSNGTLNITGNITGGSTSAAVRNNGASGIVNITGAVTGGSANTTFGVYNQSTGTVNITGNVTGGTISGAEGVRNVSTGTITIIGSAIASNLVAGANNSSTGILNVKRAVGNGYGIGTVGINSVAGVTSAVAGSQTRVEEFEFGALGQIPVSGAVSCPDLTTNVCIVHRLGTTKKTLVDSVASADYPVASNVRSGTSYNFGNSTGTLAVPAVGSVALGVAVDNTVGTAVLTPSAVWNALTSGMTTSGSIGERLKNAATVGTTGQALADALSPTP